MQDLGCSIDFLKYYLELQFKDGMSWDNWGPLWELDHRDAYGLFDLTDPEQVREVCHYSNLMPLLKSEHAVKTVQDRAKIRAAKLQKVR